MIFLFISTFLKKTTQAVQMYWIFFFCLKHFLGYNKSLLITEKIMTIAVNEVECKHPATCFFVSSSLFLWKTRVCMHRNEHSQEQQSCRRNLFHTLLDKPRQNISPFKQKKKKKTSYVKHIWVNGFVVYYFKCVVDKHGIEMGSDDQDQSPILISLVTWNKHLSWQSISKFKLNDSWITAPTQY